MALLNKPGTTARMFNERRSSERSRGPKSGLIRSGNGPGTMECVVRNHSARGAKLSFKDAAGVPQRFQLKLDAEREWRNATVKWRRGNEVGVSFER
jgi:hypothetical protein